MPDSDISDPDVIANEYIEIVDGATVRSRRLILLGEKIQKRCEEFNSQLTEISFSWPECVNEMSKLLGLIEELAEATKDVSNDFHRLSDFAARMFILAQIRKKSK